MKPRDVPRWIRMPRSEPALEEVDDIDPAIRDLTPTVPMLIDLKTYENLNACANEDDMRKNNEASRRHKTESGNSILTTHSELLGSFEE